MTFRNAAMCAAMISVCACGTGSDADDADDAQDTASQTSVEGALLASSVEQTDLSAATTDEQVATAAAAQTKTRYSNSCLTTTQAGNTVTYVMVDCTGPYGLVHVTGTLVVKYSAQAGGVIKLEASGSGIKVNKATVEVKSTGLYTKVNGVEKIVVDTQSSGTGPRGHSGVRVGHYTATRDSDDCRTLNGTWSTAWDGARATSSTTATALQQCADKCPVAGGTVQHTGVLGRTVTLTFDGSASADWSSTNGKSGTVTLQCTAN